MLFSEILISANKKIIIIICFIFYHYIILFYITLFIIIILFMTHLATDRETSFSKTCKRRKSYLLICDKRFKLSEKKNKQTK